MSSLRVRDVMTRYVEFLEPTATVQDAAALMGELDVGGLPIGDASSLEGVITDRDILYRVVARGLSTTTDVRSVMSQPVVTCRDDDALQMVIDAMAAHHIRRMAVLSTEGNVAGWITLADISRRLLVESHRLQETLRDLTEAEAVEA
ncbi:CBS domain-containing protein [Lichenicoccus roseus]|nr:CBS domain-containing protein [Lichenicoccus roseus]